MKVHDEMMENAGFRVARAEAPLEPKTDQNLHSLRSLISCRIPVFQLQYPILNEENTSYATLLLKPTLSSELMVVMVNLTYRNCLWRFLQLRMDQMDRFQP